MINQILEETIKSSPNVLVFSKAFPLVEDPNMAQLQDTFFNAIPSTMNRRNTITSASNGYSDSQVLVEVGPSTRYSTNFRRDMLKQAKDSKQPLNVKFDILNRELIAYVRDNGCKIWHISSHVFEKERLCVEGANGLVEYLTP